VNALSYQPTSPTLSDVDCGVVATFALLIIYLGLVSELVHENDMQVVALED
jgi:hypothetical protein